MKFFTREWHGGDDDEPDGRFEAYRVHLDGILSRLPPRLLTFAKAVNVHDALVRQVRLDRRARALTLDLRVGNTGSGYFDLDIHYGGLQLATLDGQALARIAQNQRAEALYDEFDLAPNGRFVHRWLWWPYEDVDLEFESFEFTCEPRDGREFEYPAAPFVEIA